MPVFSSNRQKSFPPYIIELIKKKRECRTKLRKSRLDKEALRKEYNKISKEVKEKIRIFTEKKWKRFLEKFGSAPASSREFWQEINKARRVRQSSGIPNLVFGGLTLKSDESKADLFASHLGTIFSDVSADSDFDGRFKSEVEDFTVNLNFSSAQFDVVTISEIVNITKSLKVRSACGPDKIHNMCLKNLS